MEGKPVGEGARVDEEVGSEEGVVRVLETCLTWLRRVRAAKSTQSWPPRAMTTEYERVRSLLENAASRYSIDFNSAMCVLWTAPWPEGRMKPWRVFVLVRREAAGQVTNSKRLWGQSQPEPKPGFVDDNGDKQQMIPSVPVPRCKFQSRGPPNNQQ